jgi:glucose-6-phosphate 1-dehydrogenase
MAKQPGPRMRLQPVGVRFSYRETFKTPSPEAYETLLGDVIAGDATLFMLHACRPGRTGEDEHGVIRE